MWSTFRKLGRRVMSAVPFAVEVNQDAIQQIDGPGDSMSEAKDDSMSEAKDNSMAEANSSSSQQQNTLKVARASKVEVPAPTRQGVAQSSEEPVGVAMKLNNVAW